MSTEDLKNEIVSSVGYDPKCAPMQLNEAETAKALGVKASTLSVWRSTGRYDLRYVKTGRLVRYRVSDIAEFIERRTVLHTLNSTHKCNAHPCINFVRRLPAQAFSRA